MVSEFVQCFADDSMCARMMLDSPTPFHYTVHGVLKRGVYKPVRAKYSRLAASTAAFFASGVFHEWLLSGAQYCDLARIVFHR